MRADVNQTKAFSKQPPLGTVQRVADARHGSLKPLTGMRDVMWGKRDALPSLLPPPALEQCAFYLINSNWEEETP
ncbi:hypothetical protein TNCV_3643271 [Trichonephila clavipes]|nr:hypothetical protein TNCV_3643271 [Trichonephila clavipes]